MFDLDTNVAVSDVNGNSIDLVAYGGGIGAYTGDDDRSGRLGGE